MVFLRVFLFLICAICFLAGFQIYSNAESAVHQIASFLCFLGGIISLCTAIVVDVLYRLAESLTSEIKSLPVQISKEQAYREEKSARQKPTTEANAPKPDPRNLTPFQALQAQKAAEAAEPATPPTDPDATKYEEKDPAQRPLWL